MTIPLTITLIVLLLLFIGLMTNVFPFGVSAMLACVVLILSGVADPETAFTGLSSNTTIIVATMLVVAQSLGKTSIINRLKSFLTKLEGKSSLAVLIPLIIITIILSQIMGQIAGLSILLIFLQTFDEDSDLNPSRIFFMLVVVNTIWISRFPIGMGATMPFMINSFYEGIVENPDHLLQLTDFMKAGILPSIVGTVMAILTYKWIPKSSLQLEDNGNENKQSAVVEPKKEMIILGVFLLVMLGFMFSGVLGSDISNTIPALGVLLLIIFKVMPVKEVVGIMTSDMVWMVIGMQGMSAVLGETGLGQVIGETILKLLGSDPAPLTLVIAFVVVTSLLTNLISNLGTMAMMVPIAVSSALAAGMDPRPLAVAVGVSCWFAFILPTGSSGAVMGFSIGKYSPTQVAKFTLPIFIMLDIALIINLKIVFGL